MSVAWIPDLPPRHPAPALTRLPRPDLSGFDALNDASAESLIDAAVDHFGDELVLTTSFGIQSAVMLHLATRVAPKLPVVWVDTGYLPEETYRFADELTERLDLNLHVAQADLSPARMEALYGKLWEGDGDDLDRYHRIRKVEPLERTLRGLGARAWLSGLRADQTEHRRTLPRVGLQKGRVKLLPLLSWSSRDVHEYLTRHDLPYHPLFDQGYASVGDWHSSRPVSLEDGDERDSRFGGLRQECGIHLDLPEEADESLSSSRL